MDERDVLCINAHFTIFSRPTIAAISASASVSSFELNRGNLPLKQASRMIPADHTSNATCRSGSEQIWVRENHKVRWRHAVPGSTLTHSLRLALEEHLGSAEPPSPSSVGFHTWPARDVNKISFSARRVESGAHR